jgi:hypothetical protein
VFFESNDFLSHVSDDAACIDDDPWRKARKKSGGSGGGSYEDGYGDGYGGDVGGGGGGGGGGGKSGARGGGSVGQGELSAMVAGIRRKAAAANAE